MSVEQFAIIALALGFAITNIADMARNYSIETELHELQVIVHELTMRSATEAGK